MLKPCQLKSVDLKSLYLIPQYDCSYCFFSSYERNAWNTGGFWRFMIHRSKAVPLLSLSLSLFKCNSALILYVLRSLEASKAQSLLAESYYSVLNLDDWGTYRISSVLSLMFLSADMIVHMCVTCFYMCENDHYMKWFWELWIWRCQAWKSAFHKISCVRYKDSQRTFGRSLFLRTLD